MIDLTVPRVMIDLETMSSEKDAAIVSIGAVQFGNLMDPDVSPQFYGKCDPQSSEAAGLHVSKETMAWWDKQDPVIRAETFSGTDSISSLLMDFEAWMVKTFGGVDTLQTVELWSRGSDFDLVVLPHAFCKVLGYYPFNFRMHRCHRTLESFMTPGLMNLAKQSFQHLATKHNALNDAKYQAGIANVALANIRINLGFGPGPAGLGVLNGN